MGDVTSGLSTAPQLDGTPPHLRITWIAWDSPFRGTGLAVGDRIVGINGVAVQRPADEAEAQRLIPTLPGQYSEAQGFARAGLAAGGVLRLSVRRRAEGSGWATLEVQAALRETANYRDANGTPVYGPGGPIAMSSDGFDGAWSGWYDETLLRLLGRLLDPEQAASLSTRPELRMLQEQHGARVEYALAHYPGPWANALQADYQAAVARCAGRAVTLPANALDFRRRGEELAAQVREQAQAAWAAAQAAHAAETIPAFPAIHPVRGDARSVAGKVVLPPPLGNGDWISDGHRGCFAAGGDGWYFLDAESEAAQAMLLARERYTRLVDPNLPAQFEFLARITGEPRLVVVGEAAHYGLAAEPLAALVGGALFVDLAQRQGTQVPFAGEAGLVDDHPQLPPDSATPAEVLTALVGAVKADNIALWRALHADWWVEQREDQGGRLLVHHVAQPPDDSMFEASRRSVLERVLDAQVAWTDTPQPLVDGQRFPGAATVDEVEAWLDHIGEFDGRTCTFSDVTVSPRWRLQRFNGGPWRIVQAQPI
jgi:hypothetical protein